VTARLRFTATGSTRVALAINVVQPPADEQLHIVENGRIVEDVVEIRDDHGTRLKVFTTEGGSIEVDYSARVFGRVDPDEVTALEALYYARPSRYCESDILTAQARADFAGLGGADAVAAVTHWVGERLSYVPGASGPSDGAIATLHSGEGVCRDYAHVVVALLRALEIPARMAAVYAPGLSPMDFHAVAEAAIDGRWRVVDATGLAPRESLLRIATGRDAADISFLDTSGPDILLDELLVSAVVDELPIDDQTRLISLG